MRFMPDMNWKRCNVLVKEGELLLDMDFIDSCSGELARMKACKAGKPFVYQESFLKMLSVVHAYLLL